MRRVPTTYKPDQTIEGVTARDIEDKAIESRHLGDDEILASKIAMLEASVAVPVVIQKVITAGAASVPIFTANAPFKFRVVDVIVQPTNPSTNGTMQLNDGTNAITDAMVSAVAGTIARAITVDPAYGTIAKNGSLAVACAGDTVADTQGIITVLAVKID